MTENRDPAAVKAPPSLAAACSAARRGDGRRTLLSPARAEAPQITLKVFFSKIYPGKTAVNRSPRRPLQGRPYYYIYLTRDEPSGWAEYTPRTGDTGSLHPP
jgi:hypothetical protein